MSEGSEHPRLAVDGRPEPLGRLRRRRRDEHGDAQPPGGRLHRVKERADLLDVVADVGDQGDVDGGRRRHRPARRDYADIREPVLGHPMPEHALHPFRRLDGDDLPREQRERKGVSAAAGADVEPRLSGPYQRAQQVERGFVRAAGVRPEVGCHGGIEVAGRAPFAEALGLLAVRAHPVAPGGERVRRHGTEGIGHVPGVCPTRPLSATRMPPSAPVASGSRDSRRPSPAGDVTVTGPRTGRPPADVGRGPAYDPQEVACGWLSGAQRPWVGVARRGPGRVVVPGPPGILRE